MENSKPASILVDLTLAEHGLGQHESTRASPKRQLGLGHMVLETLIICTRHSSASWLPGLRTNFLEKGKLKGQDVAHLCYGAAV